MIVLFCAFFGWLIGDGIGLLLGVIIGLLIEASD